jgi:hypothetical protein
MRKFAVSWCVCTGLLLLAFAGTSGLSAQEGGKEETVDNPIYKHWSAFKVGATVTRREKVKFAADSLEAQMHPDHTLVKDTTIKLIEVTAKKVVVELTESEHGRGYIRENAPIKLIYFAHIKKGLGTPKESFAKHKQEDVEVKIKSKTYKATLVDTTHKHGDVIRSQQIWLTDEVPGGILKDIKIQKKGDQLISESTLEVLSYNVP